MGFINSLLGTNTNAAQNKAAGVAQGYQQRVGTANEAMLRGLNLNGQNALNTGANQAIGAINSGAAGAAGALTAGGSLAQQLLGAGRDAAVGSVQGSNAAYQAYQANGGLAAQLYGNALGLNGAAGNQAATAAFQASPGYQWQVDQATDAAARKAASLGMAASGNTLDAVTRIGSNLANQEYGSYLDRLNGEQGVGMSANNAVSANNQAAAGYQYGAGTTGASLAQQLGGLQANNLNAQGTQVGSIYGNLGSALSDSNTGLSKLLSQNNQWKVDGVNHSALTNAQAQDQATSANNGIFRNLLGDALSPLTGGFSGIAKGLNNAIFKGATGL